MIETKRATHVRACLYCHEPVAINARFCIHCGARGPNNRAAFIFNTRWPVILPLVLVVWIAGLLVWYKFATANLTHH